MHIAERLLLYATAVCAGGLLLFGENSSPAGGSPGQGQDLPVLSKSQDLPSPAPGKSEIVLHDQMGRARLVLKVADDGRPSVILKGDSGQDALTLEAANDGAARLFIGSSGRHAELKLDAAGNAALELVNGDQGRLTATNARDGSAELVLSGGIGVPVARLSRDKHGNAELRLGSLDNRPAATIVASRTGELSAEFQGAKAAKAQLVVSDSGEAEFSLSGNGGIESVMRTDANGAAEIAINGPGGAGGPSMSMLPTGDMAVRVKRSDDTGPQMMMYQSGLAEVAVTGPEGKGGPVLTRAPQGLGTIMVKNKMGDAGPSLVLAPDGTAMLGVSGRNGKSLAAFKAEGPLAPRFIIMDSTGKTLVSLPPGSPVETRGNGATEK